ncbi:hypothetical protein [Enterococcus phage TJE4]|nr:hypothetical protein [Enterococcus phage TJE4]CAI7679460.1 Hypothetical protein PLANC_73 [Enterococcus phage Planchet]
MQYIIRLVDDDTYFYIAYMYRIINVNMIGGKIIEFKE